MQKEALYTKFKIYQFRKLGSINDSANYCTPIILQLPATEPFLKAIYATARIENFLLSCIKRMALGAYFYEDILA